MSNEFHDENNLYHFSYRDPNAESHTESAAGSTVESAAEPVVTDTPVQPKKHHGGVGRVVALILSCAVISAACGFGGAILAQNSSRTGKTTVQQSNRTAATVSVKKVDGQTLMSPAEVYASTVNSVVSINCSAVSTNIFGQQTESASSGSGFIYTADGYIVTNHHVVADADEGTVVVQFYSGEEYPAAIVGTDSMNDIALLKIEAEGLQTVTVGDSDEVEVGETVEAIGNPLGDLTFTMTAGYISALDREIDTDGTVINMLQTDAAINSGNSGGPLFDMNGNIIGVTTAKVSGTTETGVTIEGLGFAIPINDVLRVVYDLQQYGRVRGRAYLGVTLQNLDAEVAEIYGLPSGPQVVTVTEGSCSEKAGLQPHDIILEFDGREINAYSDLVSALSKHRAGDTVKLKLYRAGAEIEVTLTLDERPGEEEINEAEQQAQNELEGQSGQEEEFTVPDFDGYGYDYGG